jgi:hypothetical protein
MVSRPVRISRGAAKDWNGKRGEVKESRQEKNIRRRRKGWGRGIFIKGSKDQDGRCCRTFGMSGRTA